MRTFSEFATQVGSVASPWDPVVVWSTCHGFAMLRLDGPLRTMTQTDLDAVQQRLLQSIVGWTLEPTGEA